MATQWIAGEQFTAFIVPKLPPGVEVIDFECDGLLICVTVRKVTENKTMYRKLYFSESGAYWGAMQLSVDELELGAEVLQRVVRRFVSRETP